MFSVQRYKGFLHFFCLTNKFKKFVAVLLYSAVYNVQNYYQFRQVTIS